MPDSNDSSGLKMAGVHTLAARHHPRSALNKIKAVELDALTAYKAAGLTAKQVRDLIDEESDRQLALRAKRRERKPPPAPAPGRILDLLRYKPDRLAATEREFERCEPLFEAEARPGWGMTRIGDAVFRAHETVDEDWNRYSKSWHASHGPACKVTERRVDMLCIDATGALTVVKSVQLDSWRGHWMLRAIVALLELPEVRVPHRLKPIQGSPYLAIERLHTVGGVEVWRRSLAGEPVDYCVVAGGETFHASNPKDAITGLRQKLSAVTDKATELIDWDMCRQLGFCAAGIRDFCDANDVDEEISLTRGKLREVVRLRYSSNMARWGSELRRLGVA